MEVLACPLFAPVVWVVAEAPEPAEVEPAEAEVAAEAAEEPVMPVEVQAVAAPAKAVEVAAEAAEAAVPVLELVKAVEGEQRGTVAPKVEVQQENPPTRARYTGARSCPPARYRKSAPLAPQRTQDRQIPVPIQTDLDPLAVEEASEKSAEVVDLPEREMACEPSQQCDPS